MLNLPKILDIPQAWCPMINKINDYRYFLLHSGRNSCKSHSVARFVLWLAEQSKLRIMCGREIQKSIEDSVHALFRDLINEFGLNFDVGKATIEHRGTDSTIRFAGLREQGVTSVKSMENISVAWIEEAQSITKQSLDILIPTIRNPNAKVFFTMNRFGRNDPVYEQMINRDDCLVMSANFDEIEPRYITKNVWKEAQECKDRSEKDYAHIWGGQPLDEVDNFLFTNTELEACKHFEFFHKESLYGYRIGAFDIARMGDDRCAFVVLEQKGPMQWEEIYTEVWEKKDLAHTTGRIIDRIGKFKLDISVVDGDGLGAGPRDIADFFINSPKGIVEFRANKPSPDDVNVTTGQRRLRRHRNIKSWAWHQIKDLIENSWLKINHEEVLEDLGNIMYDFKPNGERFIVSKDKMKLQGLRSPDCGDSLMMAVSEIRNINKVSDTKVSNLPKYANMDDDVMADGQRLRNLPQYTTGM